jgi:hypothetical protein
MYKCEYFNRCGDYNRHECTNLGRTRDGTIAFCYDLKLQDEMDSEAWAELEKAAETIDEELRGLRRKTIDVPIPNIEFTATANIQSR